jgi:hypothetical protein
LLPEIEDGLVGTSPTVTDRVLAVPLPHVFKGVQDNTPELFHVTETVFADPVIVAAEDGLTLQL